ncbi:MAG: hypothetical protein ACRDNK_07835, partial [Solirubrobacteraceae bacterium]
PALHRPPHNPSIAMPTTPPRTRRSELDGRVLRATPPYGRCASLIADRAGCLPDVALSALRRLRDRGLIDDDGHRPPRAWLRTHGGDAALEFVP